MGGIFPFRGIAMKEFGFTALRLLFSQLILEFIIASGSVYKVHWENTSITSQSHYHGIWANPTMLSNFNTYFSWLQVMLISGKLNEIRTTSSVMLICYHRGFSKQHVLNPEDNSERGSRMFWARTALLVRVVKIHSELTALKEIKNHLSVEFWHVAQTKNFYYLVCWSKV